MLEINLGRAFLYVESQVGKSWKRGGEMQINGGQIAESLVESGDR